MLNILAPRYPKAIAPRYAPSADSGFPIGWMKTVEEVRRERLGMLRKEAGSLVALNEKLGLNARDATMSQILNQATNSRTGTPKQMGGKLARELERACGKEVGWMDTDPQLLDSPLDWPFPKVPMDRILALDPADRGYVQRELLKAVQECEGGNDPDHTLTRPASIETPSYSGAQKSRRRA